MSLSPNLKEIEQTMIEMVRLLQAAGYPTAARGYAKTLARSLQGLAAESQDHTSTVRATNPHKPVTDVEGIDV